MGQARICAHIVVVVIVLPPPLNLFVCVRLYNINGTIMMLYIGGVCHLFCFGQPEAEAEAEAEPGPQSEPPNGTNGTNTANLRAVSSTEPAPKASTQSS